MWFSEFFKNVLSLCFGFEFLFYVWELKRMLCVRILLFDGLYKMGNGWIFKRECCFCKQVVTKRFMLVSSIAEICVVRILL